MQALSLHMSDLGIYALAFTLLLGFITLLIGFLWSLSEANWHSKNSDNALPVTVHIVLAIFCFVLTAAAGVGIYNLVSQSGPDTAPYSKVYEEPVAMVCIPSDDYKALNLNELNQLSY